MLGAELEERGDWIATASAALEAQERRAAEVTERETELEARLSELKDQERVHATASRQLDARAAEAERRAATMAAEAAKLDEARSELEPRLATVKERERAATEREQQLEELDGRNAEREKGLGRRAAKLAVSETQLANKLRDVREAEERIPVLEERALTARRA